MKNFKADKNHSVENLSSKKRRRVNKDSHSHYHSGPPYYI